MGGPKNAISKTSKYLRWKIVAGLNIKMGTPPSKAPLETNEILSLFETLDQGVMHPTSDSLNRFKSDMTPTLHLVQIFDTGGLEKFVLDLAMDLTFEGQRMVIGYTKHGGSLEREAKNLGLEVYDFSDSDDLLQFVTEQGVRNCFIHHAYEHMNEAFLKKVDVIEVMHNPYWWQLDNQPLWELRTRVKAIVCVSKYVADFAIEILKINEKLVRIIPNTVKAKEVFVKPSNQSSVFLNVANFSVQKNQYLLLLAFEAHCKETENYDNQLWMVGRNISENLASRIEKVMTRSPRLRIKILIAFSEVHLDQIYRESDYFILPSTFEGFSLASLEAAQHGLPIALTCCGGISELTSGYPKLVRIEGITPSNRSLNFDYIEETCWEPNRNQIEIVKNAFWHLEQIGKADPEPHQMMKREQMLHSYREIAKKNGQ